MSRVYMEEARSIEIFDECDILVVGGGAAGHSAAVAAARAGAKNIILLERYGYMGGDVTGGYVIMVPALTWRTGSFVRGIQEEWFTRMKDIPGAVLGAEKGTYGSEKEEDLEFWRPIWDAVSKCEDSAPRVVRSVYFEPNQLKIEMDKMLLEEKANIRVYCHSWASCPVMENGAVKGVVFESKEGRKAIMAKVVIDATGDGDLYAQAGAPFAMDNDRKTRSTDTALVFRVGGVDFRRFFKVLNSSRENFGKLMGGLKAIVGHGIMPLPTPSNDIVWFNNWISPMNCIDIKDLTYTEQHIRDKIRDIIRFMQDNAEGFENAYLYDIAPQTGVRCSRRLKGEYIMTPFDYAFHREFPDTIAWHSTICRINDSAPIEIPYRTILPKGVENLLCPGRHISADSIAIDWMNLIPQCVGTGQAAGVAAAVAVTDGTTVRDVNIERVQDILVDQDVPLPRHPKTDPYLTELCEEFDYGHYTKLSKMAAEDPNQFINYRQP